MAGGKEEMTKTLCVILSIALMPIFAYASEKPPRVKWVTKLKKEKTITLKPYQFATPALLDDVMYVGAASGHFYALDAKSGHKLWHIKLSGSIYSEPAVDGDMIYLADRKGVVYSIGRGDGKINWQSEVGAEVSSKPLITDDTVFISTTLRQIVAIDRESGGKKWQTSKEGILPKMTIKGSSSPVLFDGKIYVGYSDGTVVSYLSKDGSVVWKKLLSDRNSNFLDIDATPLVSKGILYVSTVDGKTYAMNPLNGGVIWQTDKGGPNDFAETDEYLYIAAGGALSCVRKDSGHLVWEQDFEEAEISAPVIMKNGTITVFSTSDKMYLVNAADGEMVYKRFLGKGTFGKPAVRDNMLYILSNSSKVFALEGF